LHPQGFIPEGVFLFVEASKSDSKQTTENFMGKYDSHVPISGELMKQELFF